MSRWLAQFRLVLRSLFRRRRVDQELDEEFQYHLEREIDEGLNSGLAPQEARYAALRAMGAIAKSKQECRDARGVNIIDTLFQDVRFGLRMLRKSPGFTAVAVLTLALGIGATTAIFSAVYGIVFRPLPYHNPNRLVAVWTTLRHEPGNRGRASMPDFKDWQSQNSVFEELAAYGYNRYDLPEEQGGESVRAAMVSPEFFTMLGIRPLLGRELGPEDDRERVAVLSYQLWQQVFDGKRSVIGKVLRLRDHDFEVVGIMPPSFRLPTPDVSLWLSFADIYATSGNPSVGNWLTNRGLRGYGVIGRLRDGVSLAQAQTQMQAIEARLGQSFPKEDEGLGVALVPLRAQVVGDVKHALLLFLGAVGFVLLIACVNVGNLVLARATTREREMAVRQALGGSPGRLIQQMLTESVLLGAIGAVLGVLLAFWAVQIFLRLIPQSIPRLQDVRVDGTVMLVALGVSFAVSLLFGLAPALGARRLRLNDSLREGARGSGEDVHGRMRGLLVASEIAAATVLVAGAALMLQSFVRLASLEPGFSPDHLLTVDVLASLDRYPRPWQQISFFDEILAKVRALPGVRSAGACTSMPPDISQEADSFAIQGRTPLEKEKSPEAWYLPATPGFLGTLGLPLLAGRDFSEADNADAPAVAIINQRIARQYAGRESPLGQKLEFRGIERTVIGVVGNTTYSGLGTPADFQIYVPYAQSTFPGLHFAIRTVGDPLSLVGAVRFAVRQVDPRARATRISTMERLLSRSIVRPRFYASLLAVLGFVALALSAIGIFGVTSYSVSRRTHEIGVRMALGAEQRDVMRLVVGHGLTLTVAGVATGIAGALALTRLLSSLLYGVTPTDPTTFIAVSLLLTGVALVACYLPARRAIRVDPVVALRYE